LKNIFEEYLKKIIKISGPISVAQFMLEHANNPKFNYYAHEREKIGARGDFITSPEISQVFGELIGIWCANIWILMGSPNKFNLVELGPGNGTLMQDVLRTLKIIPNFINSVEIHLIENSDYLQRMQKNYLKNELKIFWHKNLSSIPNNPSIIISNEFLDTFPIHQYELTDQGWAERYIGLDEREDFCLINNKVNKNFLSDLNNLSKGSIFEFSPSLNYFFEELTLKLRTSGGFGLFIDYGYEKNPYKSTIRSISGHKFVNIFRDIGNTDLSAYVNFGALKSLSERLGIYNYGIINQGFFLNNMGIIPRTEMLINSNPLMKYNLINSRDKLTDNNEMGEVFKVFAISNKLFENIPGF